MTGVAWLAAWMVAVPLPWAVGAGVALMSPSEPDGSTIRRVAWVLVLVVSLIELALLLFGATVQASWVFGLPDPMPDQPWIGLNDVLGPVAVAVGVALGFLVRSLAVGLLLVGFGRVLTQDRRELQTEGGSET